MGWRAPRARRMLTRGRGAGVVVIRATHSVVKEPFVLSELETCTASLQRIMEPGGEVVATLVFLLLYMVVPPECWTAAFLDSCIRHCMYAVSTVGAATRYVCDGASRVGRTRGAAGA